MAFVETLARRLGDIKLVPSKLDGYYLRSYPILREFFRTRIACPKVAELDLAMAIVAVHTWMDRHRPSPQSFDAIKKAKPTIRRAATGVLGVDGIEAITSLTGGSLVAASKFLHFLNPEAYAMWDSNVALAGYSLSKRREYLQASRYEAYLSDLRSLELPLHQRRAIGDILGNVSQLRVKEFALFHVGRADSKAIREEQKRRKTRK